MRITIVTPAAAGSRTGNRRTAARYAAILRDEGHRARIVTSWDGSACDLMIALHARRSFDSMRRFRDAFPGRPLVLVLTGTDLYRDIADDANARRALDMATCLVVLQEDGLTRLPRRLRERTHVVYQSATASATQRVSRRTFRICVVGHLRDEKDPFRAAAALEHVDASLPVEVIQVGDALTEEMALEARQWMRSDTRYRWLGGRSHAQTLRWIGRSDAMVLSSRMEGGANVICEAVAAGVPVLASRISGNIGMLGREYPGYFRVGDSRALARLIGCACRDRTFYRLLATATRKRRALFSPAAERKGVLRVVAAAVRLAGYPRRDSNTSRTGAKVRR